MAFFWFCFSTFFCPRDFSTDLVDENTEGAKMASVVKRAFINCPENGTSGSVVWFPGTDDKSIYHSFCAACKIDPSESVTFVEDKQTSSEKVRRKCVVF
jgi:hypothetical protein